MRPKRRPPAIHDRVRLQHMLEAAQQAAAFITGRARSDLDSDPMLRHALLSTIAIIGEAAANTGDAGRARVAALPWGQIVAMRQVPVDVYWGVDLDRVWKTESEDVPVLVTALEAALKDWPLTPA
jgi:uncharacterized protein with HEPN domain